MFGKEPELYYKGQSKKTSLFGSILTIFFVVLYCAFFSYKFSKLLRRSDITFYDTFTYEAEPPVIKITNENFYGGFALEDPDTYDYFIDESIYIPKAYFKRAEKKGDNFNWQVEELKLERCKLEKFGSIHQETFKKKDLQNLYCFQTMDFNLEGHFSYDLYSFFYIQFFPCVNTTEKQNCKPLEIIDHYLKNTFASFQFQDVELTPNNYSYPFRSRAADFYTTVGKRLFKEVHIFFQIVDIQTDLDWMGFDEIKDIKSEKYIKYDEMLTMTNIIEEDIYETGSSFCDFTIKLSENIRTEIRTYTKLVTILGDVGGVMEVIFTITKIMSSFSVDILYEISLVNNLFNFNIDKKVVILKDKKDENNDSSKNKDKQNVQNIYKLKKISKNTKIEIKTIDTKDRTYENLNIKSISNRIKNKRYFNSKQQSISSNKELDSKRLSKIQIQKESKRHKKKNEEIISKINMNKASIYFFFCFIRKRKTKQNILLDEGMNMVIDKLDVFNVFRIMYKDNIIIEKNKNKIDNSEMSDKCKKRLRYIYEIKKEH